MSTATVLIVDDDRGTLLALGEVIRGRIDESSVDTCVDATVALRQIEALDYDAIITDLRMPGMDGLELLARIHALRPETPTLLTSAFHESDIALRALRGGAYDFIPKPIDCDYFVAAVGRAIRVRQLSRQLAEQRQALAERAQALAASEEQFRLIVEHAPDAFIAINAEGRVIEWNPQAEAIFGWRRAEALNQPLHALVIPVAYRSAHQAGLRRFLAGAANTILNRRIELRALHRAGVEFPVEVTISPIRRGSTWHFNAFLRDITERKRTEALQARQARQAALRADVGAALTRADTSLVELLQDCAQALVRHTLAAVAHLWVITTDRTLLKLSASAWTEAAAGEPAEKVPVQEFKIGQIALDRQPFLTNDIPNDPRVEDKEWASRAGMVAFAGYPLLVENRLVGVMALFARQPLPEDVLETLESVAHTIAQGIERKRAESALAQRAAELTRSNRELEQFAYVASHDLQEPLRMISSFTQLLARRYADKLDSDANEFIAFAVDGATRMQTLINDLLTYSRVGTRGKPLAPTDAGAALAAALRNLSAAIEDSSATVSFDPLPTVQADAIQLVQLFQNLVANAIKFRGSAPPAVHVSAERQDGEWRFCVADNGIGIDPQDAEKIFVIFHRLHSREEYPGTGIGLAICKKIVERHGGCISVDSNPGQGARFYFTLSAREGRSA